MRTRLLLIGILAACTLAGCIGRETIVDSVDGFAVSPSGSTLAVSWYSGGRYNGHVGFTVFEGNQRRDLSIPFEAYGAELRFLDETHLSVLVHQPPGPHAQSALFEVDLANEETRLTHEWTGTVTAYATLGGEIYIARQPPGEVGFDLFTNDQAALTDYDFERWEDLSVAHGLLYFSKASRFTPNQKDVFHPTIVQGYEPDILSYDPKTGRVSFVISEADSNSAGVVHGLHHVCPEGDFLDMVDESFTAPQRPPWVYRLDPSTGAVSRLVQLPDGAYAPCVVGEYVYFIRGVASYETPEELWRMPIQGGAPVRFSR